MIDLFRCRCGGAYQERRGWESCVCPRCQGERLDFKDRGVDDR